MRRLLVALALAGLLAGSALAAAGRALAAEPMPPVDIALVLAVDASDSVADDEYALQLRGIAEAFRSRDVQAAIRGQPRHRIAVALMIWADAWSRQVTSAWHLIDGEPAALAFASLVEGFPRRTGGSTGMGEAVMAAVRLIEASSIEATRRVIDVSGDGIETPRLAQDNVIMMPAARAAAEAAGITINGLAIMTETPGLDDWYRREVMSGSDAFVLRALRLEDFAQAFKEKLLKEMEVKTARWQGD